MFPDFYKSLCIPTFSSTIGGKCCASDQDLLDQPTNFLTLFVPRIVSVFMLCCLSGYGRVLGDSGSMVTDSGIERWALTATGRTHPDDEVWDDPESPEGWVPGKDKPADQTLELRKIKQIGVVMS